jgi:hypothetical protein
MTNFRVASRGTTGEFDGKLNDPVAPLECFDRQLGFNFETSREKRELLDDTASKDAITGANVMNSYPNNALQERKM